MYVFKSSELAVTALFFQLTEVGGLRSVANPWIEEKACVCVWHFAHSIMLKVSLQGAV